MSEPENAVTFYILVIRKYDCSKYNELLFTLYLVRWTLRLIFIQLTK
jgi:hypothetical protein